MTRARIGLDLQLAVGTATGIGEYARGLLGALLARGVAVVPLADRGLDPWRFDRRLRWDQIGLPLAARRARVDLLHCASGTVPLLHDTPIVATVHDVAWLRVQAHARPYARLYFGRFALGRYRRAARLVTDSAFSRDELVALADVDPAVVDVVAPGVARDLTAILRTPDPEPFVLAVGTLERRKNLEVVIRALAGTGVPLVAVGPPTPYRETCRALAEELGVTLDVRGYVERPVLRELYARATVAVVPSHYEGFGYGAAQALSAGVPLVAAATSSLPEVVGDDAPLLPPDDVDAWRATLRGLFAGRAAAEARADAVRARAILRFGWDASAAALERVYAAALATQ